MCHVLRAGTQLEHGKNLGARIHGQPQPEHLAGAAQPCAQFVQLDVWEVHMAERVLMQPLCMLARARQPRGDRGLTGAEDPLGSRWVQPTSREQTAPWRPGERGFSDDIMACRVER